MAATLQYMAVSTILFATNSSVAMQIGVTSMLTSMTEDIIHDLHSINKKTKIQLSQLEFLNHFTELIQHHSDAIQLKIEYNKHTDHLFIFLNCINF